MVKLGNLNSQAVRSKKKSQVLIGVIILVFSALIVTASYQLTSHNSNFESWMTKGVYADYEGTVNGTLSSVNITGKMQVTDVNSTYVLVQTDMAISTVFAPTVRDKTFVWINRSNIDFGPTGETLTGKQDRRVTIAGLGVKDCTAYEYANEAINATYYLDKTIHWPLRISYTTVFENQTYLIEMTLKSSNISQLQ